MLIDLKLSRAYDGLIFLAEAERHPPMIESHRHAELEVNLVVRGYITYIIAGKRHTFPSGTILWIFPAQEHQLVDRSADAHYYVAVFKPSLIKRACHGPSYDELKHKNVAGNGVLSKHLAVEPFDLLRKLMDSLMEGALDADLLNREVGFGVHSDFRFRHNDPDTLNSGLRYLLILSWRFYKGGAESEGPVQLHPAVQKAIVILGRDEGNLDLAAIARQSSVSCSYLSRLFRRQVGVPLNRYRNSVRLNRFIKHQGQPTQHTLLESVYASGFGSYAQFYKVFVKSFGHGPGKFLRRYQRSLPPLPAGTHTNDAA
jgi:AraC-like DNA-binding protein